MADVGGGVTYNLAEMKSGDGLVIEGSLMDSTVSGQSKNLIHQTQED